MPFKRIPISFDTFNQIKKEQSHFWTWLAEEKKGPRREKLVKCRCDLCRTEHWVYWRWVKHGRSKSCANCTKKPVNFADLNEALRREGISWKVANVTRAATRRKTGEKSGMRSYWCTCVKCGGSRWIPWATIKARRLSQCRACSGKERATYVDPIDKNLRSRWNKLRTHKDTKHVPVAWSDFESFRQWSRASGFKLGLRLIRKKKSLPYSPENCLWVESKHVRTWDRKNLTPKPKINYERNWARPKAG